MKEYHPEEHALLNELHGEGIQHIFNSEDNDDCRNRLYEINDYDKLKGGSFWSNIGNFFTKAASTVGNAFKTVYNKALKPAGEFIYNKALKPAGQFIYDHRKDISDAVNKGIQILAKLPIPEIQPIAQALSPVTGAANQLIQGTGLF
jgi:hypothetical protein